MNNNPLGDFGDQVFEQVEDLPRVLKKQIQNNNLPQDQQSKDKKVEDKKDPVTGKPIPSKKMLNQLTQATAQLAQTRLKKLREDLEKQRLKTSQPDPKNPEAVIDTKKPIDDAVQKTLRASKNTGEFKGLVGG